MLANKPPKEIVKHAQQCVADLQKQIEALVKIVPEVFAPNGTLYENLQELNQTVQRAADKLAKPTFRIATIGTTSSGKSTAVNALIGHRIAPMESAEMSAGILTFAHFPKGSRLIIETSHDENQWPLGTEEGLSDIQIHDKLKDLMENYHKYENKDNLNAPSLRVEMPLMPVLCPKLLDLPESVQFELIDLPGLKSVDDKNLDVIQKKIKEYTFSLVILDYTQAFDKAKSDKLFKELKDIVVALNNRTDLMMFITNKVDARNAEDKPLDAKLEELAAEISQKIGTESPIKTIGTTFLLLYYIQCAWGPNKESLPEISPMRKACLKGLGESKVCLGLITESPDSRIEWFSKKDVNLLKTKGEMSEKRLCQLLHWANSESGGKAVWDELRSRVNTCFPSLVILPTLKDVPIAVNKFMSATTELARLRRISTKEELQKKIQETTEQLERLEDLVEKESKAFRERLNNSLKKLDYVNSGITSVLDEVREFGWEEAWKRVNTDAPWRLNDALRELSIPDPNKVQVLFTIDRDVSTDSHQKLIEPLRQALKSQRLSVDFIADISCPGIDRPLLQEISDSYGELLKLFGSTEIIEKGQTLVIFSSTKEQIELARKVVGDSMEKICKAIDKRARWKLQSLKPQLQEALEFILSAEKNHLTKKFGNEFSDLVKLALSPSKPWPETDIELPTPFVVSRNWWNWWWILQTIPSVDEMAFKLVDAVKEATNEKLWPVVVSYLQKRWNELEKQMQAGISHTREFLQIEFQRQQTQLQENADLEIAKWNLCEQHCNTKIEQLFYENLQSVIPTINVDQMSKGEIK